jgi:endonuclease YncB( thermonuclease family)
MARSIRRLPRLVLLATFLAAVLGAAGAEDVQHARVRTVVDGDTVRVDLGRRIATVRLIGIDTPEVGTATTRRPARSLSRVKPLISPAGRCRASAYVWSMTRFSVSTSTVARWPTCFWTMAPS